MLLGVFNALGFQDAHKTQPYSPLSEADEG